MTGDNFYHEQYKKIRRESKKILRKSKKKYVENRICKPIREGNKKPFCKHLKGRKSLKKKIILKNSDNLIDSSSECAGILNSYFHSQFNKEHQIQPQII